MRGILLVLHLIATDTLAEPTAETALTPTEEVKTKTNAREQILEQESRLLQEYQELMDEGFSVESIRARLDDLDFLHQAFKRHLRFQQRLDRYFLQKLDYVIEEFRFGVDELVAKYPQVSEAARNVDSQYKAWQSLRNNKRPRISVVHRVVRSYFSAVRDFYSRLEETSEFSPSVREELQNARSWLEAKKSRVTALAKLLPQFVGMLRTFNNPPTINGEIAGQYPFAPKLNAAARRLAQQSGIKIEYHIDGESNPKEGSLELFVSVHRDIYLDPVIMAHFPGTEGYRIFMAPNRYFPKFSDRDIPKIVPKLVRSRIVKVMTHLSSWLEDRSRRNPDFLPTGEDKTNGASKAGEGINRLRKLMSGKSVNRAVIYPEGTGSLIGNVGYVHPSFILQFIRPFLKEGVDINLRVLSYDLPPGLRTSPSERLSQLIDAPEAPIKVQVSSPWTSAQLQALTNLGTNARGKILPSYLIRAQWLEQLPTNQDLIFGQLKLEALERNILDYISRELGSKSCKSLIAKMGRSPAASVPSLSE